MAASAAGFDERATFGAAAIPRGVLHDRFPRIPSLEKQSRAYAKELAQLARLRGTDGALSGQGFMDVAALAKDRQQQLVRGLAGMLDQELQVFRGCRVIRGHAVLAVVVLNQQARAAA